VIASLQNATPLYISRSAQEPSAPQPERIRASFDCSKAATPIEKLICRDAELASIDREMATVYARVLQTLAPGSRDSLRRDQLQWFTKYRAACNATLTEEERKACILRYLSSRAEELRAKDH
jgi:uncharacterized protein